MLRNFAFKQLVPWGCWCCVLLTVFWLPSADGLGPNGWVDRTIYQLLTDRFARPDGDVQPCADLSDYCGGGFDGITEHLDYITGMGFDAIWISPVITNVEGGYHGYWAKDFYTINSHFGTSEALRRLIEAAHDRDVLIMFDVVANHVGPVGTSYELITPFDESKFYHDCSPCPADCQIDDFGNQPQVERCRLAGLPDLNQTRQDVAQLLQEWVVDLIQQYSVDGLRVDTVPEVSKVFWKSFQESAAVYAVGEVYDGRVDYVAGYQGPLDGVLSYPLFFTLRDVFEGYHSMREIESELQSYSQLFSNMSLLGNFLDNHDHDRFLNGQSDLWEYKNALTYILLAKGIPIVYYGTEQQFCGGYDPNNREPLWTSGFNTSTELYLFLRLVIRYRRHAKVWEYSQIQRYADDSFYAFSRGSTFVALTNGGQFQDRLQRTITYHPYTDGTKLCNLFWPLTDCILVENGQFDVVLRHGEPKVYYPSIYTT